MRQIIYNIPSFDTQDVARKCNTQKYRDSVQLVQTKKVLEKSYALTIHTACRKGARATSRCCNSNNNKTALCIKQSQHAIPLIH